MINRFTKFIIMKSASRSEVTTPKERKNNTWPSGSMEDITGYVSVAPLLKILECAVCLEVVNVPFKQCNRGHLVCSECMRQLSNCPTCQAAVLLENSVSVKNLLEALPRPCRNSGAGCKERVDPTSDHVSYCGFRLVECRLLECPIKNIIVSQLKRHVESDHAACTLFTNVSDSFRLIDCNLILTKSAQSIPMFVMDVFFWLRMKIDPDTGLFLIKFQGAFSQKPISDYFIDLKFQKGEIGFSFTLKASEEDTDAWEDEECSANMKIFITYLKRFIEDQGYILFAYLIRSVPKSV